MDKKYKIIIDTNYIYQFNTNRLEKFVSDNSTLADIYIPEVVLDELVHRDIQVIKKINKELDNKSVLNHFVDVKQINSELFETIRKYYSEIFYNNVIPKSLVEIEEMYKRSLSKKPPFSTAKDASDQGFKDSLIWLSILDDNHEQYSEVWLVSADNVFHNNKEELQGEFLFRHGKEISFRRTIDLKEFSEVSPDEESISNSENNHVKIIRDFKKVEDFREAIEEVLHEITIHVEYVDSFYEDNIETKVFSIIDKIERIPLNQLLNNLSILLKNNILSKQVSPYEFVKIFGDLYFIYEVNFNIATKHLAELYELLYKVSLELSDYSESIVKTVIDFINSKTYIRLNNTSEDHLPF